jgi:anaerobic magnesium-protoporphyrin IX monomethyl ester cyclase
MKKRVALINSRIEPRQQVPINLLLLAGFVQDICDVLVFDPEFDDEALREIKHFEPDIIGVTSMTQNYNRAKQIVSTLKEDFQGKSQFIMGGIHPTILPNTVLEETKVDAVCVGEGEWTLRELIEGREYNDIAGLVFWGGQTEPRPPIENLDQVPFPAYSRMPDLQKYFIPPGTIRGTYQKRGTIALLTARGCPGKCIFCASHLMFGRRVRRRSVENVIAEMELILRNYGKTSFWFADDTFTLHKSWIINFCNRAKDLNVAWGCQVRADTCTDEIIKALKRGGCKQVDVGVESGSNVMLKTLRKGIKREQYIKAFRILKENKLRALATFIIGTPGETQEDIEETKDLVKLIKPDFTLFFYMMPYPGTEVYKMAEQDGLFIRHDYHGLGSQDSPMLRTNLSEEQQIKMRNELYRIVKWRNIRNYISIGSVLGFLSMISIIGIRIFFKTWWRKKNLYDAMFAFLQDYRWRYFKKSGQ